MSLGTDVNHQDSHRQRQNLQRKLAGKGEILEVTLGVYNENKWGNGRKAMQG